MKRFESLKKNKDFVVVYNHGKSLANRYFVMYKKANNLPYNRIGISVSKKVGNSVVRHRVTRLIRESNRLHAQDIAIGYDIIVVARPSVKGKSFSEVESAFLHLAKLHHILIEVNQSEHY